MISLYFPAHSVLHRLPARAKLAGFAVVALVLSQLPISWVTAGACLVLPVVGYPLGQVPLPQLVLNLRRLLWLLAFLLLTQLIFLDVVHAATNTARVISLVLLAQLITHTTTTEAMIDTVQRLLKPLRRFGVRPERAGLAFALALSSIGHLSSVISQVRSAQRSRGVRIPPWRWMSAWVVPVLVLTLKHADDVDDALVARGLE